MRSARSPSPTVVASLLVLLSTAPTASLAVDQYAVIPFSGMAFSAAMNESTEVVGSVTPGGGVIHAGLWDGTNYLDLLTLGGEFSTAWDINDSGVVVGESELADLTGRAFVWDGTSMTALATLGTSNHYDVARGINDLGVIVGTSRVQPVSHAVRWASGGILDLGTLGGTSSVAEDINNAGQIVGWSRTSSGLSRAFLWEAGSMVDLGTLGGSISDANAINDAGVIVGQSQVTGNTTRHASLWNGNSPAIDLGTLGGSQSEAFDINASGQVVGTSQMPVSVPGGGFLWEAGMIYRINDLLDPADSAWSITSATAINDDGWILARGRQGAFTTDVLLQPLPEPGAAASWLAIVSGLRWLAARKHRLAFLGKGPSRAAGGLTVSQNVE